MKGFTLIELIVVLAIAAILATVGLPSMVEFVQNNRLAAETNRFVSSIRFARSEAVKRNEAITLNSSANSWSDGWAINVGAAPVNPTSEILRNEVAASQGITISSGAPTTANLTYQADGTIANTRTQFFICDERGSDLGRVVTINVTGRVDVGELPNGTNCP